MVKIKESNQKEPRTGNYQDVIRYTVLCLSFIGFALSVWFVLSGRLGNIIASNRQSEVAYAEYVASQRGSNNDSDLQNDSNDTTDTPNDTSSDEEDVDSESTDAPSDAKIVMIQPDRSIEDVLADLDLENQTLAQALNIELTDEEFAQLVEAELITEDGFVRDDVLLENSSNFLDVLSEQTNGTIDITVYTPEQADSTESSDNTDAEASNPQEPSVMAEVRIGDIEGSVRLRKVPDRDMANIYYYVVEQYDTLESIASYFETPIGQLMELNYIDDADEIYTGEILIIPDHVE